MNQRKIALRTAAGVAISAASIYLVTQAISIPETVRVLGDARWAAIGLTIALLSLDVAIRSIRWRVLLGSFAVLAPGTVLAHLLVGYLANNALPARLGELVRAFSIGDREGISRSTVVGTVIVERFLDLAILALAVLVGVAFVTSASVFLIAAGLGLAIGLGGLIFLYVVGRIGSYAKWLDRVPAGRIRSTLHGLINGTSVIRSAGVLAQSALLTALAWAITALAFAAAASAVGVNLSIAEALLFAAAVNLATAIPAGPGYVGTFELAAISVAAAIGISPLAGLASGVIVHVGTLALTTIGGLVSFALLHVLPDRASEDLRHGAEQLPITVLTDIGDERTLS